MTIARKLAAAVVPLTTVVLVATVMLFGSPRAFACDPSMGCDSTGSSSSGSSSSGGSSGDSGSSGSGSSGDSSSGHSSGSSSSSSSCDAACRKKKDEKRNKKATEPSAVLIMPRQDLTPRAPIRQPPAVVPPAPDFVPAQTPVLTQDAVSRGSGELIPTPNPASGDTPAGAEVSANGEEQPNPQLTPNAQPATASRGTFPPWAPIGGVLALVLLGAGLTFAPARQPPMPATAAIQNNRGTKR